ncbi:Fe2+/Zn2+ uptake regulation protein [Salinisphaera hydrothermalis C27AD]
MARPAMSEQREIAARLRSLGLRATAVRCAVLSWLADHPHATANDVCDGVRDRVGSVSKQAVYDVLSACADVGLVRQIKPFGHPVRFERHEDDNHHHLICRCCGTIVDTHCRVGNAPCLTPASEPATGFVVDQAEIVFWGVCARCRANDRSFETNHARESSRLDGGERG